MNRIESTWSPRRGFTLVELMVSMALILFIMVILAEAFSVGLESLRQLKAVGDMQEKLRVASEVIRRDLQSNFYDTGTGINKHLSDLAFGGGSFPPPNAGFFRLWQYTPASAGALGLTANITEGTDGDGFPSIRMADPASNILHFGIFLGPTPGTTGPLDLPQNFLSARITVPGTFYTLSGGPLDFQNPSSPNYSFTGQWGEVVYFLGPVSGTSQGTTGDAATGKSATTGLPFPGQPLFTLFRRQLVAADPSWTPVPLNAPGVTPGSPPPRAPFTPSSGLPTHDAAYFDVSCKNDPFTLTSGTPVIYFNSPTDLTKPDRRFGMVESATAVTAGTPVIGGAGASFTYPTYTAELGATAPQVGDDILLTNVISFSVQLMVAPVTPTSTFVDVAAIGTNANPTLAGLVTAPAAINVFDTWSAAPSSATDPWDYSTWATAGSASTMPLQANVVAVQIILRVYDQKTERTRQITIIQNM
jgi:prepilin-type N-terminal cleavage/methylation domain-containing protein